MASRQYHGARNNRVPSTNRTAAAASNATNTSEPARNDNHTTTTSRPTSTSVQPDDAPSTVRRNLFPPHLMRRAPSSSFTTSATASRTASGTLPATSNNNATNSASAASAPIQAAPAVTAEYRSGTNNTESLLASTASSFPSKSGPTPVLSHSTAPLDGDMVARDKNGCYKVDVPVLPARTSGEDAEDDSGSIMEGVEPADAGAGASAMEVDEAMGGMTQERLDGTINEMMRRHRSRQATDGEPPEVLILIQEILKGKVAELDEDNWMYEIEDEIRI